MSLTLSMAPTGEHFRFQRSAHSEEGLFRFEWTLEAGHSGPPPHAHPIETETFVLRSGKLRMWLDGGEVPVRIGVPVTVQPGVVHSFLNDGSEPCVVDVTMDGPLQEDAFVGLVQHLEARGGGEPTTLEGTRQFFWQVRRKAISTGYRAVDGLIGVMGGGLALVGLGGYQPQAAWDQ